MSTLSCSLAEIMRPLSRACQEAPAGRPRPRRFPGMNTRVLPVVLLSGPPASGKSTFAEALAKALEAALIDLDTATAPLLSEVMRLNRTVDIDDPQLVSETRKLRYETVFYLASDNLRVGRPVVCVAPFTTERREPDILRPLGTRFAPLGHPLFVWLDVPRDIILERMRGRAAERDAIKLSRPEAFLS